MRVIGRVVVGLVCLASTTAMAQELTLLAAGSLRDVMTELTAGFTARYGLPVRVDFGPSDLVRERIERGERTDVFACPGQNLIGRAFRSSDAGWGPKLSVSGATAIKEDAPPRAGE
jgi:ABC-type molybdate transport system substrate-binding protein